jgi:hypothetical protein
VTAVAQTRGPLTNDDIVKMARAGLSSSIIITTIETAPAVAFDVSPAGLIELKSAGVEDRIVESMQAKAGTAAAQPEPPRGAPPEPSEQLATSRDPSFILRNFKTMVIEASGAVFFRADQVKAALWENKDFAALGITLVDDPSVADVVLEVGYTFAWDYPFSLRHRNTSVSLLSGKGSGPFSGPAGATSVAKEFIKHVKPHRAQKPATDRSMR